MFFCCLILLIAACSRQDDEPFLGYIEGEYIYIGSGVPGTLLTLAVKRGQQVKLGQLLYVLDPQPEQSQLAAAKADTAKFQAEIKFSQIQLQRKQYLYQKNALDKSSLDEEQTNLDSLQAQLNAAEADVSHSTWHCSKKYACTAGSSGV